jgi:hypothetical protein
VKNIDVRSDRRERNVLEKEEIRRGSFSFFAFFVRDLAYFSGDGRYSSTFISSINSITTLFSDCEYTDV